MTKKDIFVLTTIPLLGYIFLPVLFQNIPLPGLWFGSLLIYIGGLILAKPIIFLSREFFAIYALSLIYFLLVPNTANPEEQNWLLSRIVPLFVGVSLYTYFFRYAYDPKGLRFLFWLVFIFITITSLTTLNGLSMHPEASRELASSAGGDTELANYYQRLGIAGYGYITALAYWVPLMVLFFKREPHNIKKTIWLGVILLLTYTVLQAQYTTQLGLFVFALILALMGFEQFAKYKLLIVIIGIFLIAIPSSFYANLANYIASTLDSEILSSRISDFGDTISSDSYVEEETHTSRRAERIPFLLSEFIRSPIIGGGQSSGHVFWLDHLSLYGIVGAAPWLYLLVSIYKRIKNLISKNFYYFQIAFLAFLLLGFFKNSGNREQYIILFFALPGGLFLLNNKKILN
ncbi:hypothetical protein DSECCO2_192860 [anaerobic digester metagenome]